MCISAAAAIAGATIVSAGVTAFSAIQGANARKDQARFQADMSRKEIARRMKMERLRAGQEEGAKAAEFARNRSRQLAAIAASQGFQGENISFLQGIDPEQRRQFRDTSMAIRLGLAADESLGADQIQVTDVGYDYAKFNSGLQKIQAGGDFIGQAAQAASFYQTNKPGKAGKDT